MQLIILVHVTYYIYICIWHASQRKQKLVNKMGRLGKRHEKKTNKREMGKQNFFFKKQLSLRSGNCPFY